MVRSPPQQDIQMSESHRHHHPALLQSTGRKRESTIWASPGLLLLLGKCFGMLVMVQRCVLTSRRICMATT